MKRRLKLTKLRLGAFLAAVLVGSTAVAALAYFATRGTGSSAIIVTNGGTPAPVAITLSLGYQTHPALTPGGAGDTIAVSAANPNSVPVTFALTPVMRTDGTGIYDTTSSAFVDGCKVAWYTAVLTTGGTDSLAAHATSTQVDTLTVSLIESGGVQDACENLSPEVDISAS